MIKLSRNKDLHRIVLSVEIEEPENKSSLCSLVHSLCQLCSDTCKSCTDYLKFTRPNVVIFDLHFTTLRIAERSAESISFLTGIPCKWHEKFGRLTEHTIKP